MPLLNYTTKVDALQSASEIEVILIKHGAKSILKECDNGKITALSFMVKTPRGDVPIRMPVDPAPVLQVLKKQGIKADMEQAERIAWRITKDWTEAQMALLETEMVSMTEIYFAHIFNPTTGKTLFQTMEPQQFLLGIGRGE